MPRLKPIFRLLRPHQYVKNGFVLLPLFFGHKLNDPAALKNALWAFVAFCLTSSSVYVLNDIRDREADRHHPEKCRRPLAEGSLLLTHALAVLGFTLVLAMSLSLALLPPVFLVYLLGYFCLNVVYSFYLKDFSIIDLFCIATGFVLRVLSGGQVVGVPVSHWIIIMTFLLAILIALGKRRDDLFVFDEGENVRKSLQGYSLEFISLSMVIMSSVVIVAYILYCVSPEVTQRYGTDSLYLTGFWVLAGVLRYMQLVFVKKKGGSPTLLLLHDGFLWLVILGWLISFYVLIYAAG